MSNPQTIPTPTHKSEPRPPRLLRTLWMVGIGLIVAGGLLVLLVAYTGQRAPLAQVTLDDGSILRLEAVTFGESHEFIVQRQSAPPLPQLGLGKPELSAHAEFGELFPQVGIWLTRRDAETGAPLDLDWLSHCVAVDADGWEHASRFVGRCHWDDPVNINRRQESLFSDKAPFTSLPAGKYREIMVGSFLPLFKPTDGRFPLEVYNTHGEVVATFDAPYPAAPPEVQAWTADRLPVTRSAGDLEVTLERLDWSVQPTDASVAERHLPTIRLQPEISLKWQGEPSEDWRLTWENVLAVEDGLGNLGFMDRCDLTPNVPAWKVGCVFSRTPEGRYEPHEEWNVGPIEFPDADTSLAFDLSSEIDEIPVKVVRVCGMGSSRFTLAAPNATSPLPAPLQDTGEDWQISILYRAGFVDWTINSDRPAVVWQLQKLVPGGRVFLTRIFDAHGDQLAVHDVWAMPLGDGERTCVAFFEPPVDPGPITVRPTIYEHRSVSFLVTPPPWSRESSPALEATR